MTRRLLLPTLLALATTLTSSLKASEPAIVARDDFRPSLNRTWGVSLEAPAADWTRETRLLFSCDFLRFRFFSGRDQLRRLEIVTANSGATVWSATDFSKPVVTPRLDRGEYLFRWSGVAGPEKVDLVANSYVGGRLMPDWSTSNADATFPVEGGVRLRPAGPDATASIGARIFNLAPGRAYDIEVTVATVEAGELTLRLTQRTEAGRSIEAFPFTLTPGRQETFTARLPAAQAAAMNVALSFTGECHFHGFQVREAQSLPRLIKAGSKTYAFEPRAEADPPNHDVATPVVFQRPLRMTYQDSIPQNFELVHAAATFAPRGEWAVWHFALHNPGQARAIGRLEVSDLVQAETGAVLPAATLAAAQVAFWDFPRGPYSFSTIPELLEPQTPAEMPAGQNRVYWLQTRLPPDCPAGLYNGLASVACGEQVIRLPLRLRVLPFRLETPPDMVWSVYSRLHVRPQAFYSHELTVRYLQDMKDYGVTSLHCMFGSEAAARRYQEARVAVGLDGPLVIRPHAEHEAMRRTGITPENGKWWEHPDIRQAFVDFLRELDSWLKKYAPPAYHTWYYMGADEPHIGSMEAAGWQNRLAREAGIPTASCVYAPRYVQELAENLNLSCNMFIARNQDMHASLQAVARGRDLRYWFLGGGAYVGQEGGLQPNRLEAGFRSFKLGVTGHLSYTYQAYGKKPYDHFTEGRTYGMTYPHPNPTPQQVTVSTLAWEGIREGITDYKYLHTLRVAIARARDAGLTELAAAGQETLETILAHIPWQEQAPTPDGITRPQPFNDTKADQLRALAADAILRLNRQRP